MSCRPSQGPETLAHAPGPRPTVEEVLSGKIPGRPEDPAVDDVLREDGYARERVYTVPPIGEHPRILFARSDLPRIRAQLAATATGRRLQADLVRRAGLVETDTASWTSRAYRSLATGDVAGYEALWKDADNPVQQGPPGSMSNPILHALVYRGFHALLQDDAVRGRENAVATHTYARWLRPRIEAASLEPGAENFWLAVRGVAGETGGLALPYDLARPFMTDGQAAEVKGVITLCLRDRYGLGMDLPRHWRNWNFIGMGLYFPLMAHALEGDPGLDPRILERGRELARDYAVFSHSRLGSGSEGLGYQTAGMAHFNVLALALANRGHHLLPIARYRAMLDNWMLWTMQPFGRMWATEGDLGTFPPAPAVLQTARFFFPDDERIRLVADQAPPVERLDGRVPEIGLLQLLAPEDLGRDAVVRRPPTFPPDLPLHQFDSERGVLHTRSDWTAGATALQFHARSDTTYPSHDHADRGAFFLTALGRVWSVPSMRETESKYQSVVTIDGLGQGYFPTPARWLEVHDSGRGTSATVDLSYCYNWRWMKSSFLASDGQLAREPWLEWVRPFRDRLLERAPRGQWERDPLPQVRDYFEKWQAGDPRMWGVEDAWVLRAPYNPVRKAFRSVAFVRGDRPFVLIADDIRKDEDERLYEWRMILPMDVEAHHIKETDIVLGPVGAEHLAGEGYKTVGRPLAPKGTPMLLVRVLVCAGPRVSEATPVPAVETIEFVKHDDVHQYPGRSTGMGRRLVVPSRSVEPKYSILLAPHRAGDPLPVTEWEPGGVLAVRWGTGTTRIAYLQSQDGAPRLSILP